MGITIHYEGRLRSQESYEALIKYAQDYCALQGWPFELFEKDDELLQRVRDEQDWDYQGPVKGINIRPHDNCEPFLLEFDRNLYIQEYTKTQFAPAEVHAKIVAFLHHIESLFEVLDVVDEAEYYETGDLVLLEKHLKACDKVINEYLGQTDKYYGPVRLESQRIVDVLEKE